jgi:hypothetical protein
LAPTGRSAFSASACFDLILGDIASIVKMNGHFWIADNPTGTHEHLVLMKEKLGRQQRIGGT